MKLLLNKTVLKLVLRHAATAAGGWVVAQGILSHSQLEDGTGALLALVAIGHSVWEKKDAIVASLKQLEQNIETK